MKASRALALALALTLGLLTSAAEATPQSEPDYQALFAVWADPASPSFHSPAGDDDKHRPSPIEEFCSCVRQGSLACGCRIETTGTGSCRFRPDCSDVFSNVCHAINLELCVVRIAAETVSPFR
ncbi:MAG: hypothetical protein OEV00_11375 [Acidobacteriota bacterium]|nr:hypothetical protein [Acidobacteriota bacterium]MDH3785914.1 hypothetical protein [Acidobacteriota bacterium]